MNPFRKSGERADDKVVYFSYAALVRRKRKWLPVWRVLASALLAFQAWGLTARFEGPSWLALSLGLLTGVVVFWWMRPRFGASAEAAALDAPSSERVRVASESKPAAESEPGDPSEPAEESLFVEEDRGRSERRS
jgi:hypothetical protein